VASLFLSVALLMIIFFSIAGAYKKNRGRAPKGIQSFFEPIVIFIRDDIARSTIVGNDKNGRPKYEKYLPFLLTVFFFIWFNNLLGLFPGGANLTGNIAVTMVLALITLLITLFSSNKYYWQHIFATPGVPKWLLPIMVPVEIIGIFTKPFSLMIRLFANITAGHIIILSLFGLIFIFRSFAVGPISVAFATFMSFIELLVAILQAYIFTLLSAMYIGSAVEGHEAHDDYGH
jgi:F-type H+-transporting ATPase subunit a